MSTMTTDGLVWIWKGKSIQTVGDVVSALGQLEGPEDGAAFATAYAARSEHAAKNIGYCAGYLSRKMCQRVLEWCHTAHPIFGRSIPTADEEELQLNAGGKPTRR